MAIDSSILAWENPIDRGAWGGGVQVGVTWGRWGTVHGVAKNWTRLSD